MVIYLTISWELFFPGCEVVGIDEDVGKFDIMSSDVSVIIIIRSDLDSDIGGNKYSLKIDGNSISGDLERGHCSISKVCTPSADDSSNRSNKLSTRSKGKVSDYPDRLLKEQSPNAMTNADCVVVVNSPQS